MVYIQHNCSIFRLTIMNLKNIDHEKHTTLVTSLRVGQNVSIT